METRAAAKRKANAAIVVVVEKQHPKRQRVVLGELPNLQNLIVSKIQNPRKEKLQCRKNPNANKPSPTNNTLSSPQLDGSYVSDIHEYLREMEMQKKRRPMVNYIEKFQKIVTPTMRGILVDWLVEVAEEYKLLSDTLHLSVSYIDRKYEETDPPSVDEFCSITDNTYDKAEVVKMEADILKSLKFEMGNPTTPNSQIEHLGSYIGELSLLDYDCLRFLPSIVAASVIFLAKFIIWPEVHPWALKVENLLQTSSLCECSGYKPAELKECVLILHDLYLSRKAASFKAVREKYKHQKIIVEQAARKKHQ
ncbi:hypothetical protein JHK85_009292 [Glycine max]|nr:hypothetical protein JHK85_009292 [Glycine max]